MVDFMKYAVILLLPTLALALKLNAGLSVGLDFGTTGCRYSVIDSSTLEVLEENSIAWNKCLGPECGGPMSEKSWHMAMFRLLKGIDPKLKSQVRRICVSGTSATVLMVNHKTKQVTRKPRMYNYNVIGEGCKGGNEAIEMIKEFAPPGSSASTPTSCLAKLITWNNEKKICKDEVLFHQADFLSYTLLGGFTCNTKRDVPNTSDWHNVLKLGFDVHSLEYPDWLKGLLASHDLDSGRVLPKVVEPGTSLGQICPNLGGTLGFSTDTEIVAGTTDSIAAFYAAGVSEVGHAVTSLGSTLVIKMLSEQPVEDSRYGVYSHRLGANKWLVGGASNVGCAILKKEGFTDDEIARCSQQIDPLRDSELRYYPLVGVGERFPVNDPRMECVLEPKPASRAEYLHGLLQAISEVERDGFAKLEELGASPLREVHTAGGGARNDVWMKMRQRVLGKSVHRAANINASFGVARLGTLKLVQEQLLEPQLTSQRL